MIVVCIIATLAAIAVPLFTSYLNKARVIKAIGDIRIIEKDILSYQIDHDHWPDNLSQVASGSLLDPWNKPYQYINIGDSVGKGKGGGKFRKDRFLHPINTDYDLYSMGIDGKSILPLTAEPSRDDIIRANNGGYIGLAWKY